MASAKATLDVKRTYINEYKLERGCEGDNCQWAGEFSAHQLDLDHIDPSTKNPRLKKKSVAFYHLSYNDLAEEMAKCRVLCANCHREHTHG